MKNLVIIGAGQIGSRHLQGLAKINDDLNITVIDPSSESLETAKERYFQVDRLNNFCEVNFRKDIPKFQKLDIAIIATSSKLRKKVIKDLLVNSEPNYFIIEKVAFQNLEDFEEIKNILGTFDDFILTSLSLQNNGQNFIDKKQAERKQILSQFMGIDLFDKLYDIARRDVVDERAVYKKLKQNDLFSKSIHLEESIKSSSEELIDDQQKLTYFEQQLTDGFKLKDILTSQLKEVDDIQNTDFDNQIQILKIKSGLDKYYI